MLYITTEEIWVRGTYTEPMYDEAPWLGTYDQEVTFTVPSYTGIWLDESGKVDCLDMEITFGVSLHKGKMTVRENFNDRIGLQLIPISEAVYDVVSRLKKKRDELIEKKYYDQTIVHCMAYLETDLIDEIREQKSLTNRQYQLYAGRMETAALEYIDLLSGIQKQREEIKKIDDDITRIVSMSRVAFECPEKII